MGIKLRSHGNGSITLETMLRAGSSTITLFVNARPELSPNKKLLRMKDLELDVASDNLLGAIKLLFVRPLLVRALHERSVISLEGAYATLKARFDGKSVSFGHVNVTIEDIELQAECVVPREKAITLVVGFGALARASDSGK